MMGWGRGKGIHKELLHRLVEGDSLMSNVLAVAASGHDMIHRSMLVMYYQ